MVYDSPCRRFWSHHIHRARKQDGGSKGLEEGRGWGVMVNGAEFHLGRRVLCRCTVPMATQHCERIQCHRIIHLAMAHVVNFMFGTLDHNCLKKAKETSTIRTFTTVPEHIKVKGRATPQRSISGSG